MGRTRVAALIVGLVAWGCSGASGPSPSPRTNASAAPEIDRVTPLPSPLPAVVAVVNGQAIPLRSVRTLAEAALAKGLVPRAERAFAYRKALQDAIDRELLFQEATARGVQPDLKAMERVENEARVKYQEERAWRAHLARQGLDPDSFRAELRIQHTVDALFRQVESAVPTPTDEEAGRFYDANPRLFETGERLRCSQIEIERPAGLPPGRDKELRQRAEKALLRVRRGEDFSTVARETSKSGGELPPFARGDKPQPYERAAFALEPGGVSDVVETPAGFYVIKLHQRLPSAERAFDLEQVQRLWRMQKMTEDVGALVSALRARARIETYL